MVALILALIVWVVTSGGGGNSGNGANGGGHAPATTITPGPSASGPLNSSRPGGSVGGSGSSDSGSGGGAGSGTGGGGSSGGGTGDTGGGTTDGAAGSSSGGTGGTGGGTGGTSGAVQVPAGSTLPDCTASAVALTLRSAKNSYETYEKPKFRLTAANSSGTACKLDFGPTAAVLTITDVNDNHIWATGDCPANRSAYLLQVPANSSTTYDVTWDRRTSSPQCATPKGQTVPNGATYLVEAKLPGFPAKQTSFFLKSA
jgi:hypothetical protein